MSSIRFVLMMTATVGIAASTLSQDCPTSLLQVATKLATKRSKELPSPNEEQTSRTTQHKELPTQDQTPKTMQHNRKLHHAASEVVSENSKSAHIPEILKEAGEEDLAAIKKARAERANTAKAVPNSKGVVQQPITGTAPARQSNKTADDATLYSSLKKAADENRQGTADSFVSRLLLQFVFALVYYFVIVSKYPSLDGRLPNIQAKALQSMTPLDATWKVSWPNCLLACCCTGPRAAHTLDKTAILDYWPACVAMTFFPCCTIFFVNWQTDLNDRLGGEKDSVLMALCCAFWCSCCIIAQDAETLDVIMNLETGFTGVTQRGPRGIRDLPENIEEVN